MKKIVVFLLCTVFSVNCFAVKPVDSEQQALIEELISLIDDVNIKQYFKDFYTKEFSETLAENMPESGDAGKRFIEKEVSSFIDDQWENKRSFQKRVYKVISIHFTKQELKKLIEFYSSDLGKKALVTIPEVYSDTMGVAKLWGHGLEKEIREYLSNKLEKSDLMSGKNKADSSPRA